ncbi:hypothetical protein AAK938_09160 [Aerococcaceae bacterium 50-4]
MFNKNKSGFKWLSNKTDELNRELFEWHEFKFLLVILSHFTFIQLLDIDEFVANFLLQLIGLIFWFLLFAPPSKKYKRYEGTNQLVKGLDTVERVVLQINEVFFQSFNSKLVIGAGYTGGFISLINTDNSILDPVIRFSLYFLLFLLFMKPEKKKHSSK